ncbi:MAG TPA: Crp/Fnr family transcriptional regulator [Pyrinomonadaceae bacterium]|nr:Crp/Fnr family transcriptional regulator [Pyrinomonadaceae bacterium]
MKDVSHNSQTTALELTTAAFFGDAHIYPASVELFSQGAHPGDLYFVHSGILKLARLERNGQEILLDLRFPGSLVGSAAAIKEKPHPFAAVTVTSCTLTRLSSRKFLSLLATDISLAAHVREILSDEVLDHVERISQLTCLSARQRLEQLLWRFCEQLPPSRTHSQSETTSKLQLPLKQYEIAHLLSITPTYLCRLLNALEKEDVISRTKGWIMISKPSELWHAT